MQQYSKQVRQHTGTMETETIQKNGARPKSLTSRGNYLKKLTVFCFAICVAGSLWGQKASDYRSKAEQGDAEAQYNLGVCYNDGDGVEKNSTQAVYWYRKAAEQGHAKAQNNLGVCYNDGDGVEKNYTQEVYWYRKAAEQGYAKAQYNLGICYFNGDGNGVDKNHTQAVYWFRKAAEQGDAEAQYNLGVCYYGGYGVEENKNKSLYWYEKALKNRNEFSELQITILEKLIKEFKEEGYLPSLTR
jgi:TPR repeat protein